MSPSTKKRAKPKPKPEAAPPPAGPPDSKVSFFPAWCKQCGNCIAFCPRQALQRDQWGAPFLARPERCTSCGLCEMLCPDFAISVGEAAPVQAEAQAPAGEAGGLEAFKSPERMAPVPVDEED